MALFGFPIGTLAKERPMKLLARRYYIFLILKRVRTYLIVKEHSGKNGEAILSTHPSDVKLLLQKKLLQKKTLRARGRG